MACTVCSTRGSQPTFLTGNLNPIQTSLVPSQGGGPSQRPRQSRPCFYCLEMGHLKANCHKITRQYPLNYISVDKDVDTVCSSVDIVYNSTQ